MMRLRFLCVPALLSLALTPAFVSPADSLTFHVEPKTKLTKTFENKVKLTSEDMSITIDGNDAHGGMESPKVEIADTETIQVTDEYAAVEDGRATKLVRSFVELSGESVQTTTMPDGSSVEDHEEKTKKESPLEGKTVVFTWKDDDYVAAWAEDERGDDDLLEKLEADMDLLQFLPSKEVATGDTWALEPKFFNAISSPGGRLHLRDPEEEDRDEMNTIQDRIEENIEGEGQATYKGTREVDGVRVGVIEITAELESSGSFEKDGRENTIEYKVTYAGQAFWDVKAGHLRSFELEGTVKFTMDMKTSMEFNGESHDLRERVEFGGEFEHRITFE